MDNKAHGGHIAALIISGFQAIAPELVASGFFGVIVPPYYKIWVGNEEENANRMYLREKSDLAQWCAKEIFAPRFELAVRYDPRLNLPNRVLNLGEYTALTHILFDYGLLMDNISSELSIPPELLESLARCTHYLTPETMNTEIIREAIGADAVSYDRSAHCIVVTYLDEDISVPLIFVRDHIYGPILSTLRRLDWTNWGLLISTTKNQHLYQTPVTFYQLYTTFKQCRDTLINIETLKGLGSMNSYDLTKTCLDPRNRKLIDVRGLGDVQRITSLMEKDSSARKQLGTLVEQGLTR